MAFLYLINNQLNISIFVNINLTGKETIVRIILNEETQEFIAKYFGDLSKAILTVGFASYFFEKLTLPFRIGFIILSLIFLLVSIMLMSKKGGK